MSSLVIVAIPEEDDVVWKVSSEKKPHLTLMYLGEVSEANNVDRMAEFVEHALNVNEHGPFYLDVDHRGELGPDKADVLFFENGWDSKWIKSLRGQLLKESNIQAAYQSNDQFPEWVPHLTLGYPTAPAKPLPDEYRKLYNVCFDRIAIWTGDYEGPEFRLKWPDRTEMEDVALAYHSATAEETIADIIQHHGVKGMRWGHRKDDGGSVIVKPKSTLTGNQKAAVVGSGVAGAVLVPFPVVGAFAGIGVARLANRDLRDAMDKNWAQNKEYKKDRKWEKEFKKDKRYADVHNDMADHMDSWLVGHNKKYDGVDLNKDPAKMKEYEDAYFKEQEGSFAKSYSKIYGSSPSGNYKVSVIPGTNKVVLHNKHVPPEMFHEVGDGDALMVFAVTHDKFGRIVKVEPSSDSLAQSSVTDTGEEFILEHFGTKGMRWGVRKEQLKSGAKAVGRGLEKVGTALADADFEDAATNPNERARLEIIDKADEAFVRTDLPKINAKPEYVKASKLRNRLRHPRDPMTKQYRQEVKDTYIQRLEHAANTSINASGTRQYTIRERGWELPVEGGALPQSKHYWEVSTRPVSKTAAHAADAHDDVTLLEVLMDDDGFITGTKQVTESDITAARPAVHSDIQTVHGTLMHRVELGEEFIKHYGTKGMKWGQRKAEFREGVHNRRVASEAAQREKRPAQDVRAYPTIGPSKRSKAKVDTKGGFDHPPTEDAIKVEASRQKMKKSGVKALTNKELQEVATRLNLENQVHTLESKQPKSLGKKFVDFVLSKDDGGGKKNKNKGGGAASGLGGMAVKSLLKLR